MRTAASCVLKASPLVLLIFSISFPLGEASAEDCCAGRGGGGAVRHGTRVRSLTVEHTGPAGADMLQLNFKKTTSAGTVTVGKPIRSNGRTEIPLRGNEGKVETGEQASWQMGPREGTQNNNSPSSEDKAKTDSEMCPKIEIGTSAGFSGEQPGEEQEKAGTEESNPEKSPPAEEPRDEDKGSGGGEGMEPPSLCGEGSSQQYKDSAPRLSFLHGLPDGVSTGEGYVRNDAEKECPDQNGGGTPALAGLDVLDASKYKNESGSAPSSNQLTIGGGRVDFSSTTGKLTLKFYTDAQLVNFNASIYTKKVEMETPSGLTFNSVSYATGQVFRATVAPGSGAAFPGSVRTYGRMVEDVDGVRKYRNFERIVFDNGTPTVTTDDTTVEREWVNTRTNSSATRTLTLTEWRNGGLYSKKETTWKVMNASLAWEEITQETVWTKDDGTGLTTTYEYTLPPPTPNSQHADYPYYYNCGRLQLEVRPGGEWTAYEYNKYGQTTAVYTPWLNCAVPDTSNANWAALIKPQCRCVATTYDTQGRPEVTVTTILGVETARREFAYFTQNGERVELVKDFIDANHFMAKATYYTASSEALPVLRNKIKEVRRFRQNLTPWQDAAADGTKVAGNTVYSRELVNGEVVTTAAQDTFLSPHRGARRTEDMDGRLKQTEELLITGTATVILETKTFTYAGESAEMTSALWNGQFFSSASYATALGLRYETVTDAGGHTTVSAYDILGRLVQQRLKGRYPAGSGASSFSFPVTVNGTSYTIGGIPDYVTDFHYLTRTGGGMKVEEVSYGEYPADPDPSPPTVTKIQEYDMAGQLVKTTDETGHHTWYATAYSTAGQTITRKLGDGTGGAAGTVISTTEYAADGQVLSVIDVAKTPVHYRYAVAPFALSVSSAPSSFVSGGNPVTPAGTRTTVMDGLKRKMEYTYPAAQPGTGRPSFLTTHTVYGADGNVQASGYITPSGTERYRVYNRSAGGRTVTTALSEDTVWQAGDYIQQTDQFEYVLVDGRWWERTTESFVENGVAVTSSVTDELISGLNAEQPDDSLLRDVTRITVMGRTDETVVTVEPGNRLTRSSFKPADSSRAGETVTVCGLTVAESSARHTGISWRIYTPFRLLLATSDPKLNQWDFLFYNTAIPTQVLGRYGYGKTHPAWGASSFGTLTPDEEYDYHPINTIKAGLLRTLTYADASWRKFDYNSRGQLIQEWGSAGYPVAYAYDPVTGEMTSMWTFQGTPSGSGGWAQTNWPGGSQPASHTRWIYDPGSRVLLQKMQDASAVTYSYDPGTYTVPAAVSAGTAGSTTYNYTPSGHLSTRTNGRNQTATHASTAWGEVQSIIWASSAAAPVYYTYRDSGRVETITDASGKRTIVQRADGRMTSETITNAASGYTSQNLLSGATLSATYNSLNRRTLYSGTLAGGTVSTASGYSSYGKLSQITAAGRKVTYGYHANSGRVQTRDYYTFNPSDSSMTPNVSVMTAVEQLDSYGRIKAVINTLTGGNVSTEYTEFDARDRRKKAKREDAGRWEYTYNARGEVTAATRRNSSSQELSGYQSAYDYDAIGNRKWADHGSGVRRINYTGPNSNNTVWDQAGVNARNEYTGAVYPAQFDVMGQRSSTSATVTVNTTSTADTLGLHFWKEITGTPALFPVTVKEGTTVVRSGVKQLPWDQLSGTAGIQVKFTYDGDGNLTYDGYWNYTWDAENRLIYITGAPDSNQEQNGLNITFAYDSQWRRIYKAVNVALWDSTSSAPLSTDRYLYDGWNPVGAWRDQTSGTALYQQYVWGPDLSQSAQGAGGVGGLVMVVNSASNDAWFPCMDGSGNVLALVAAEPSGGIEAQYEYDPFGQTLRSTGTAADINPFRFSTKFTDETGLLYYGFRYYHPGLGRWISRDPLQERGGKNLLAFVNNSAIGWFDYLGKQAEDGQKAPSESKSAAEEPKKSGLIVIISSFKGFQGRTTNPSQAVAEKFAEELEKKKCCSVVKVTLDVVYDKDQKAIQAKIAEVAAANKGARIEWIAFGQGGGKDFQMETTARNDRDTNTADNAGQIPGQNGVPAKNREAGKDKIESPKEDEKLLEALGMKKSDGAGQYLCESVLYELLSNLRKKADEIGLDGGKFFHTPYEPTADQLNEFPKKLADAMFPTNPPPNPAPTPGK